MSISVVIPAYRAAHTIRRAVDSILAQTRPAAEIIVVDDGSPDRVELADALKPYGDSVSLFTKENGGVSSARNYGIDQARGEWIAFIDADDYWEPEKLARQRAILDQFPEVSIVGCSWFKEEPGFPRAPDRAPTWEIAGRPLRLKGDQAFCAACTLWTCTLLIRRDLLQDQRFATDLPPAEDRDLWYRLLSHHTAYILPDYLATYVQEPGGISRTNIDRDCSAMLEVIRRHTKSIGTAAARRHTAVVYRRWSSVYLSNGKNFQAFPFAVRRFLLQPYSLQASWIVLKSLVLSGQDVLNATFHLTPVRVRHH